MTHETIYEVTSKILGKINPQGESNIDAERLENLKNTLKLSENLIDDIIEVSKNKERWESSMKVAGLKADKYLLELKEALDNLYT